MDGLSYLVSNNLHKPSLDSSDILMNLEGDIQIGRSMARIAAELSPDSVS